MTIRARAILVLAALAALSVPLLAQAPDCTGISDISNFDGATVSDLNGNLTTVRIISAGLLRPLFVTSPPGDLERLFILQQDGTIRIFKNGALNAVPFLDISGIVRSPNDGGNNEEGLLGLAFHPDYATNGWFFVYHTDSTGANNVVARYTVSGDPDVADALSRQQFIAFAHPTNGNHNGGMIAFREQDGYLYIGTGDGGSACDPPNNAQNLNSNLGKLLRINVDAFPYTTVGNPFDGATPGNNEIWAYGLRNPWRFSFDRITQSLYIGDVGQNAWEEVDCTKANSGGGENYQWDVFEGNHCAPGAGCSPGGCATLGGEGAIYEYASTGRSINGGYVYRGCRMGDLGGTYFFSDHISNVITSFRTDANCGLSSVIVRTADLDPDGAGAISITQMTSFGEDNRGELYIVDRAGEIFKILPNLNIMEVSGLNATQMTMGAAGGDWTWENLQATSSHPISIYKVYRSGSPTGPFDCAHQSAAPSWVGGDPDVPLPDQAFYYLVTARNAAGEESRPGYRSDGTPRTVNTASVCPTL